MINYFYFKEFKNQYLLTNDLGRYIIMKKQDIVHILHGTVDNESPLYTKLKNNYFISDDETEDFIESAGSALRDYKKYLFTPTTLHIFVVTKRCNQSCIYCQASSSNDNGLDMSLETAKSATDLALSSPAKKLTFEFQGGEPLLNFNVIRFIVEYSKKKNLDKEIEYVVVTNLTVLSDGMIDFFITHGVSVSSSLDGNMTLHNQNRPMINSHQDSYHLMKSNLNTLKSKGVEVSAIQTTTKYSLNCSSSIVEEYINLGLSNVFLRPLTPLGFAKSNWDEIGYQEYEFITFYKNTLRYIINKNMNGIRLTEGHAKIFLTKILGHDSMNYMELRSPCGGAIGQLAYYYNGDIYTCDEARMLAEMGDNSFRLGNVSTSKYNDLVSSVPCKAVCQSSILESNPICSLCVYNPYCGVCPVVNMGMYGNIYPPVANDFKCNIYKGMLDVIFEYLYEGDENVMNVFKSWII